jgi:hypothetical protein
MTGSSRHQARGKTPPEVHQRKLNQKIWMRVGRRKTMRRFTVTKNAFRADADSALITDWLMVTDAVHDSQAPTELTPAQPGRGKSVCGQSQSARRLDGAFRGIGHHKTTHGAAK